MAVLRKRRRIVGIFGVFAVSSSLFIASAVAAPVYPSQDDVDEAQAQVDDTASQIAGLEVKLASNSAALETANVNASLASDAYNQSVLDLQSAEAAATAAADAAAQADAEVLAASQEVARLATAAYRNGGDLQQLEIFLSADGLQDAVTRTTTFNRLGGDADESFQRLDAAELVAGIMQGRADAALADKRAAADALETAADEADRAALIAATAVETTASDRAELITQLAALRNTTYELEADRQTGLDAQRAARDSAAAAAAIQAPVVTAEAAPAATQTQQVTSSSPSTPAAPVVTTPTPAPAPVVTTPAPVVTTPTPTPAPAPAPPAAPAPAPTTSASTGQAALNWAMTQLGKPYVWGATGPNGYDCSGLTMRAYQNAGVSLPRTTRDQYAAVAHVPVGAMRPGDLIFYSDNGAASGIYHLAIYAGNGMRVQSPSPGKTVEYVKIWWTNVLPLAGRP